MIDCHHIVEGTGEGKKRIVGLFAGIGGIELGFRDAGYSTSLLCEIDEPAGRVLQVQMPDVPLHEDITTLQELPCCDVVTAGFPCQDLSQAGRTAGIGGNQSGLVEHVFRLLDRADPGPTWLLLENVSFMLSLDRGRAMTWLVEQLERRGFNWAYRVVDSLAFGLPQRRQRVLLLASRTMDPRPVLLNQATDPDIPQDHRDEYACGFYWTEGLRGLGWAIDSIPTLKGGSAIGIPSPPAIWNPGSEALVTPDIRDAERLQGFEADWTKPAEATPGRGGSRWRLVGNAVSVPVAKWVGHRLTVTEDYDVSADLPIGTGRWPRAAWGYSGARHSVETTMWPVSWPRPHLLDHLEFEPRLLSARATAGFLDRANRGSLRIPEDLICEAKTHLTSMKSRQTLLAA